MQKNPPTLHREPERLFAGGRRLPLIKAIGWNQTALALKRFSVAGFLADGVGAGVGEFVADGFIFRPGRNQSPASLRSLRAPHRFQRHEFGLA